MVAHVGAANSSRLVQANRAVLPAGKRMMLKIAEVVATAPSVMRPLPQAPCVCFQAGCKILRSRIRFALQQLLLLWALPATPLVRKVMHK
jgi:hypothetical protein